MHFRRGLALSIHVIKGRQVKMLQRYWLSKLKGFIYLYQVKKPLKCDVFNLPHGTLKINCKCQSLIPSPSWTGWNMHIKIILISYLSSKSIIVYEFFLKTLIFKIFCNILTHKKLWNANFYTFLQPPKFYFGMILNTKNGNYMSI